MIRWRVRVQACNIDEVMDAHDRYLGTILSKAMLDSHTEALRTILNSMFDCCQRSVLPLREAEAQITAKAGMLQQVRSCMGPMHAVYCLTGSQQAPRCKSNAPSRGNPVTSSGLSGVLCPRISVAVCTRVLPAGRQRAAEVCR